MSTRCNVKLTAKNRSKKWFKIFGEVDGQRYHLATVASLGNASMVAEAFAEMPYENITIE